MSDEADETLARPSAPPSARAAARAAARARARKRIERREGCFDLLASGYTPHEIAKAMKVSAATVRRMIDRAIDDRRLDAPERYAHVQVTRLSRMLCALDDKLAGGDMSTVGPLLKVLAAMDRYHGMNTPYGRGLPDAGPGAVPALAAAAPLALTHDAAVPLAPLAGEPETVA